MSKKQAEFITLKKSKRKRKNKTFFGAKKQMIILLIMSGTNYITVYAKKLIHKAKFLFRTNVNT